MPVFFINADQVKQGEVVITPPLLHHLRASLRIPIGEILWVGTPKQRRYQIKVTSISTEALVGRILDQRDHPQPTSPRILLGQALLKGDKTDWIIQKATELGVGAMIPLITKNTIARPSGSRVAKQQERWQRIALEAAQQAECWEIPAVSAPQEAAKFFTEPRSKSLQLILRERESGPSLGSVDLPSGPDRSVLLTVGPEGGWTPEELDNATAAGFVPINMGDRILRAETAALAALCILQSRLGELS